MKSASQSGQKLYQRIGWVLLFVLSALVALSSLFIAFAGPDESDFLSSTGINMADLSTAQPKVADYIDRLDRLVGAAGFGFGTMAAAVTFFGLRRGFKWSWYVMWTLPVVLAGWATIFFVFDAAGLGSFYTGAGALSAIGLILTAGQAFGGAAHSQGD